MRRLSPWLRRVPTAGWLCALVAVVSGLAWMVLTPPYHVPDENAHVAYVQYLAETGNLPVRTPERPAPFSDEQNALLGALRFYDVIGRAGNRPLLTAEETRTLRDVEAQEHSRVGPDAGSATENGPLYYALAAVPYWVTPSDDLLDRMVLIRLLSVLFMGMTVVAVFLFLREVFPADPWLWTVGGLLAALEPMAGFMAGGVNPDTLLFFLSSLAILLAARCLRRGLTVGHGLALGAVTVAGLATKPLFQGMLPGIAVAVLSCVVLARRRIREPLRGAAAGVVVAGAAAILYVLLTHTVVERTASAADVVAAGDHPMTERLSYMWQLFLPRLPFMEDLITGFPLQDLWLPRLLGQFGWLDYGYPEWVGDLFFWLCIVIAAAAIAALVRHRDAIRPRLLELVTYLTFVVGVLGAIGWVDYRSRITGTALFEQGRYLLPLLAILVGIVCVVLKALGPRIGKPVGAALVMAMLAASVYGQLMTVQRFYG